MKTLIYVLFIDLCYFSVQLTDDWKFCPSFVFFFLKKNMHFKILRLHLCVARTDIQ